MFSFKGKTWENKTAVIVDNGLSFTYYEIHNFSEEIYKHIQHRCLVFCLAQNTVGSLFGYISFLSNSIVPVMLDSGLDLDFLEKLIESYKPEFLWIPDNRVKQFSSHTVFFSKYNYSLIKLERNEHLELHQDLAVLLSTSGSTGSLKFVKISYENLKSNTESIISYLYIDEHERPITTLPMWYSYGLSVINSHLLKGATLLLTSKTVVEKDFWGFFKAQKATSLSGVPYTFQVLKELKFSEMQLNSLKTLTQAGGKLNHEVNKYFSDYAINSSKLFYVMYGQTEATARMSYLSPEYSINKPGSIGQPIHGGEFFLVDDGGNKIHEADTEGELVYKGKNVSMGYARSRNELLKGDENYGILFTGDLAIRDTDNFYYIVGRKNRLVKLFGNRINLDETETLISKIINDCACIGTDDNMVIFITDEERIEDVRTYIATKTKIHPSAFNVIHVDKIPRHISGKVDYSVLKKLNAHRRNSQNRSVFTKQS